MVGTITLRGLKVTLSNLHKIDKRIKGPVRKKMLQEVGQKTKGFAQRHIKSNTNTLSGHLIKSMHYRVFPNRVSINNDAGEMAWSWERGMKPHFIHRSWPTESGYSVGDWMDANANAKNRFAKRNWLWVGTGTIGSGIRFMEVATMKIQKALPNILKKYSKMMIR